MKHFYFIALSTILFLQPCVTLAMNSKKQTEASEECETTLKECETALEKIKESKPHAYLFFNCIIKLKKINEDEAHLYHCLNRGWNALGKQESITLKPSELIENLIKNHNKFNKTMKFKYKPATWYIEKFVKPLYNQLDQALEKKLKKSNNKEAFKWFDKYFQQNALAKPIIAYKKELLKANDEQIIKLSGKDTFFSNDGNTIIVYSSKKNNSNI